MVEMEEEEKWFCDIYITFSLLVLNVIILFYTYLRKRNEIMITYLNLDEKGECRMKKGKE